MPALRDRIEDLPALARFFLRRYNLKFRKNIQGIADSTLQILSSYWWPGNIRELENLIERLVAVSDKDWITDEDLPYELHVAQLDQRRARSTENLLDRAVSTFERNFLIRALEKSAWNVTGDRPHARHSAEHAQVQDGQARNPRACAQDPRQRRQPAVLARRPRNWPAAHRLVLIDFGVPASTSAGDAGKSLAVGRPTGRHASCMPKSSDSFANSATQRSNRASRAHGYIALL